jgi:dienelactone hydrolase
MLIDYAHGDLALEGYFAAPAEGKSLRRAIVLYPEWHGVSAHARRRADMFADLGYTVLIADMYGKGIRPTAYDDCAREAGKYKADRGLMRARARAALDHLKARLSDANVPIVAIGYCFGGTVAIELASEGAALRGVVAYHANLDTPTPDDAANIVCPVLALHGADDPVVPDAELLAFQARMRKAKVDWQVVSYGNTVHSFTNWNLPTDHSRPAAYNKKTDKRSWIATLNFFDEIF